MPTGEAGGNFIDTADSYSSWVDGNHGGESEEIIGRWLAKRGCRDEFIIATKVGRKPDLKGLSPATIRAGLEDSLRRLGIDHVDLYYAHADDPDTPLEQSLETFAELVAEGSVRHVAASNYTAPRLAEAMAASRAMGARAARYVALQVHYNLVHRQEYEGDLEAVCRDEQLSCLAYSALADGFLTGKYRPGDALPASARADDAAGYLDDHGIGVLAALDVVAARHASSIASVALAWLMQRPAVAAAVASARTPEQVRELVAAVELELSGSDMEMLNRASIVESEDADGTV